MKPNREGPAARPGPFGFFVLGMFCGTEPVLAKGKGAGREAGSEGSRRSVLSRRVVARFSLNSARLIPPKGARWDEIDMEPARWTIPASRMKAGREFSVPLSTGALDLLERARELAPESSLVFPSKTGEPLPRNALGRVLHRAGVASTVHGFRSSARSWMAESGVPAEVAEACLAHVPRSKVVQAYQRSDLLERRAEVLQAWSDYVT